MATFHVANKSTAESPVQSRHCNVARVDSVVPVLIAIQLVGKQGQAKPCKHAGQLASRVRCVYALDFQIFEACSYLQPDANAYTVHLAQDC